MRGYRPEPVPDEVIREVFDLARFAQSGTNSQPWHIAVVSGGALADLRHRLCARFDAGDPGGRDIERPSEPLLAGRARKIGLLLSRSLAVIAMAKCVPWLCALFGALHWQLSPRRRTCAPCTEGKAFAPTCPLAQTPLP